MRDGTPDVLPKDGVEMFSLKRVILFGVSQFVRKRRYLKSIDEKPSELYNTILFLALRVFSTCVPSLQAVVQVG